MRCLLWYQNVRLAWRYTLSISIPSVTLRCCPLNNVDTHASSFMWPLYFYSDCQKLSDARLTGSCCYGASLSFWGAWAMNAVIPYVKFERVLVKGDFLPGLPIKQPMEKQWTRAQISASLYWCKHISFNRVSKNLTYSNRENNPKRDRIFLNLECTKHRTVHIASLNYDMHICQTKKGYILLHLLIITVSIG